MLASLRSYSWLFVCAVFVTNVLLASLVFADAESFRRAQEQRRAQSAQRLWDFARPHCTTDPAVIAGFLQTEGDSQYAEQAHDCLSRMQCEKNRPNIEKFLDYFPESPYASQARACLQQAREAEAQPESSQAPILQANEEGGQGTTYYVAVASSPAPRSVVSGGVPIGSAVGWSTLGSHDAGRYAEQACNALEVGKCYSYGSGQSMQGGCVSLVLGSWREAEDSRTFSTHTAGSSTWRDNAEQQALDSCKTFIHTGKPAGTILNWQCEPKKLFCSEDVRE